MGFWGFGLYLATYNIILYGVVTKIIRGGDSPIISKNAWRGFLKYVRAGRATSSSTQIYLDLSGNENKHATEDHSLYFCSLFIVFQSLFFVRSTETMRYFNFYWGNNTGDFYGNSTEFDSNLVPVEDVSVDAVLTAVFFNSIVFVMLMITYEVLRRLWPHVYSSRKRLSVFMRSGSAYREFARSDETISEESTEDDKRIRYSNSQDGENVEVDENLSTTSPLPPLADLLFRQDRQSTFREAVLPDNEPLDWIHPIQSLSWTLIRKVAGLDGYFFLRYIRMLVRITAVSSFWFFLILVPVYITGSNNALGWYHLSAANVSTDSWRMWMPVLFAYFFCAFVVFVIKQEYRHYLELRQDFLARGSEHVLPQNRYSLMIENIPYELRSDRALYDYFDNLFPGKVHSACVVLKVPELEEVSRKCMRSCRRLEKSIAHLHASGKRPSHRAGQSKHSQIV